MKVMTMISWKSVLKTLKHRILYPVRERLVCSEKEAIALLVVLGAVFSGHVIRIVQATKPLYDDLTYVEMDSLFEVLSALSDSAAGISTVVSTDTIHSGFGATFDHVAIQNQGAESWALVDTLEKPTAAFPVAINTADARTLQALPRIGPAMAQRILLYRAENGIFRTGEDLLGIRGIGTKTLDQLLPLISFDLPADSIGGT